MSFYSFKPDKKFRLLPGVFKNLTSHYARHSIYLGKQRNKFEHSLQEVSNNLELGITPEILHHWYFRVTNDNFQYDTCLLWSKAAEFARTLN